MADKINFRRGSQEEIINLNSYEQGAFYLANDDTVTLYYGKDEDTLAEIGINPFHWGQSEPANKKQLWIHDHPTEGGLKFYNHKLKEWVHVPVAFTSRVPEEDENVMPSKPSSIDDYTWIETYLTDGDFTALQTGWYKIEVFGASGNGGSPTLFSISNNDDETVGVTYYRAAGGGGGAYACDQVMLNAGDKLTITTGTPGNNTSVVFNATVEGQECKDIVAISGGNGTGGINDNNIKSNGVGGAGGTVNGGTINAILKSGNAGETAGGYTGSLTTHPNVDSSDRLAMDACKGGASGIESGNKGGNGAGIKLLIPDEADAYTEIPYQNGKNGYVKIYLGNQ